MQISADGKRAHPNDEIGKVGMAPAVKFFSDMKDRFWIKEKAAPYGGALKLGQVWEGTDNQTRVGQQGIILSVFAGPILPGPRGPRVPTPEECTNRLKELYPGYIKNRNKFLFRDWPNTPFIKTGYVSPRTGQIFTIVKKLNEPFHGRLFFAGEHTQMDFFGYMEGALRSGKRAAELLMSQSCGLRQEPLPVSPNPPVRTASAAPIRARAAF
jgi:monoamine oxidase